MKKLVVALALCAFVVSCSKVPITGRKQLNLLPESQLMSMSLTSYKDFIGQNNLVSTSDPRTQMVKRCGDRIAKSATAYLKNKGQSKRVANFKWEFNLVDDPTVNAWCMPGGKVVFYTGILPATKDETGMAVVMGHEVAHAIARHGNERMSQQLATQVGGMGLSVAISEKPELTQNIFLASYGAASTLATLKYSRTHESEADKMGLVFMAKAGYDPRQAVDFWKRMSAMGGAKPPELLSTHPHDDTRIKDIQEFLPQALKYYNGN